MKKIGAIVKGKYYSLTSEQKELLINWRELKAQKKKLAKKKRKVNIKLDSIKENIELIEKNKLNLSLPLKD